MVVEFELRKAVSLSGSNTENVVVQLFSKLPKKEEHNDETKMTCLDVTIQEKLGEGFWINLDSFQFRANASIPNQFIHQLSSFQYHKNGGRNNGNGSYLSFVIPHVCLENSLQDTFVLALQLQYNLEKRFLSYGSNQGIHLPATMMELRSSSLLLSSTVKLQSNEPLLMLPLPDFSMPYNVITLSGTCLVFFMGSMLNLLFKKQLVKKK